MSASQYLCLLSLRCVGDLSKLGGNAILPAEVVDAMNSKDQLIKK